MAIFVCDECGVMENSSLGHYWSRENGEFEEESKNKKALCSQCAPSEWKDGSSTKWGKWHNKFPRAKWDGKRTVMNR